MVDPQPPKKKNGKKKKSSLKQNSVTSTEKNLVEKENCNINKVLPNKVGMKTTIKDVEVTMMPPSSENPVGKNSGKKKKKESKQNCEINQEPEKAKPVKLLNFSNDGGIKLVNHPEISVTVAKKLQEKSLHGPKLKDSSSKSKDSVPNLKHNAPKSKDSAPNLKNNTSKLKDSSSKEKSAATKEKSAATKEKSATTKEKSALLKEKCGVLGEKSATPKGKSAAPKGKSAAPKAKFTAPKEKPVAPKVKCSTPAAPKEKSVEHKKKSSAPKEECQAIVENSIAVEKKKRRRRKKKNNMENQTAPTEVKPAEPVVTSPTYVKLPASGDTCVLVVSHESFSNGHNGTSSKFPDSRMENVISSIQNEKSAGNKLSLSNSVMPIGNSISLFPISSDGNKVMNSDNLSNKQIIKDSISEVTETQSQVAPNGPQLTKAQLKAERRAKQEAQRAAKAAKGTDRKESDVQAPVEKKIVPKSLIDDSIKTNKESKSEKDQPRKVRLFSHLPQFKPPEVLSRNFVKLCTDIHPAMLEIGAQYAKSIVCGSNARCIALMGAFRELIKDYTTPPEKEFSRGLEATLQTHMNFLNSCRPLSVSMLNALKFLKHQINHLPKEKDNATLKSILCSFIEKFVREEILLAKLAIGSSAADKIVDGDVILVFAYSSLVKDVLTKAFSQKKKFRVIVMDSRPKMEALKMLHCLVNEGISCSYALINAVSYIMKEVSKVILGAHALLSNGCVMSRVGCSQIALVASSYRVPVLVCCETYKFCERALTDSFVHNELGDPKTLATATGNDALKNWHTLPSLQLLNLLYDVTPSDLISMVITEKGVLPCTSVPVVLRVRHAGLHE